MSEQSDQEIDLRPYISAVASKWYWILGAGIVVAVLGFIVSTMNAPAYEATALVAITEPRQKVQFDPRIQTVNDTQPVRAYPELALSDELLGELLNHLPDQYELSLTQLRRALRAAPGSDPSLLRLSVSNSDPTMAADLANIWAELFVAWANQIYGDQGDEQLLFFEKQLADATVELELADQALIDFQAHNLSGLLENELWAMQQTQADYLAKQRQTDLIMQDIESLLAQKENNDGSGINQLASILLQTRALGGVPNDIESTMPWQFQINVTDQSNASDGNQRAIISNLYEMLQSQSEEVDARLAEIEPQVLAVQQKKQEANAEENRLQRDLEVSEETYATLARTVEEKRITSQDTTSGVKLASKTAVPDFPTGPRKAIVVVGAGLLGIIVAVAGIVLYTWWREN